MVTVALTHYKGYPYKKASADGAESAGRPSANRLGELPKRGLLMSLLLT